MVDLVLRWVARNLRRGLVVMSCLWVSVPALAGMDQAELQARVRAVTPRTGVELEVLSSDTAQVFAVAASYSGGPRPAHDTIVVAFDPPPTGRVHASYFQSQFILPFQTRPVWRPSLGLVPRQTEFAIWREDSGEWGAIVPLVGGGARTYLEGRGREVYAIADSLAPGFTPERVPLFAIGWDPDPYRLIRQLYGFAFAAMRQIDPQGAIGRLRWEKPYPEIFNHVGWCSWNAHYRNIDEAKLLEHGQSFARAGFPVGFFIIDDCWSPVNTNTMMPWSQGRLYLTGLGADPKKFPGGLEQTIRILKAEYGVKWVGVWHTFNGYWNGIERDSEVGRELPDALMPISRKVAIPDPRSDAGAGFWDAWFGRMAEAGVDFIKTDNQGTFAFYAKGAVPVSRLIAQAQRNFQGPAERFFKSNVLNCMEMNVDTIYQWETTNLGRSSVDYAPGVYTNPRENTVTNLYNVLWFSNLTWPDYDMFQTHGRHVEFYTVARAISGGPIYTTDVAGKEDFEKLWPLILSDGRVIRVDEPGLPIEQCLLRDPQSEPVPLAAFARVGAGGVLAAWNVNGQERPVAMALGPADVAGLEAGTYAVYEHFTGSLKLLARDEREPVRLKRWEVRLYMMAPVVAGFAPIGLVDKYISLGTVVARGRGPGRVAVTLAEAGRFVAYAERAPAVVRVGGVELGPEAIEYRDGLLSVEVPAPEGEAGPVVVEIVW